MELAAIPCGIGESSAHGMWPAVSLRSTAGYRRFDASGIGNTDARSESERPGPNRRLAFSEIFPIPKGITASVAGGWGAQRRYRRAGTPFGVRTIQSHALSGGVATLNRRLPCFDASGIGNTDARSESESPP